MLSSTFPRWAGDSTPPFVFELCRRLTSTFEVWVVAPHALGAAKQETIAGMRIVRFQYLPARWEKLAYDGGILANLHKYPLNWLALPFFLLALLYKARTLARIHAFDTVHAHWVIPQGWVATHLMKGGKRVVCTAHGSDLNAFSCTALNWLQKSVLQRASEITVVSQALAEKTLQLGVAPEKVSIIPMGIDTRHTFQPTEDPDTNNIVFVGRLTPEKGLDVLLRALPTVVRQHANSQLTIVGDGPLRKDLEALAKQLHIQRHVKFVGAVPHLEVPSYIQSAVIVAVPSIREGFGLVAAEALACGRAVVASDIPSLRELIEHNRTGLLFSAGDSHALAQEIISLLADRSRRVALACAGHHAVAERLDWERIAERYTKILGGESSYG